MIMFDENNYMSRYRNYNRRKKLLQYIEDKKPDIIISLLPEPTFRLMSLRNKIKIPIIISVRNDPKVEYSSKLYYILMRILYREADGFIFQTNDAKSYFSKDIQEKGIIIPNPINENFLNIDNEPRIKKENTIINVGRLAEQKNQKMLINAFKKLDEKYKDYRLKIFGEGNLRETLNNQINELGLNNRVLLEGETNHIKEELKKAKLFVLTSNYEGMPNALMEAMAVGLPVISTDCPCGGPKYLIQNNENGILIKTEDENELVDKMTTLLEQEDLAKKLGENAKNIVTKLNPKKIYSDWEKFILQILNNYKE